MVTAAAFATITRSGLAPGLSYSTVEAIDQSASLDGIEETLLSQLNAGRWSNFAGYDRFAGNRLVDYYCMIPSWLRETVIKKIINRIPESPRWAA